MRPSKAHHFIIYSVLLSQLLVSWCTHLLRVDIIHILLHFGNNIAYIFNTGLSGSAFTRQPTHPPTRPPIHQSFFNPQQNSSSCCSFSLHLVPATMNSLARPSQQLVVAGKTLWVPSSGRDTKRWDARRWRPRTPRRPRGYLSASTSEIFLDWEWFSS